jgi:hypothetical protein
MALAILDGTQTATTLSTILSSGQHITAHTVVSLGTQAITDMRSAVSGSVVSVSNFPATQPISGSVTIGNSITIGSLPAISGTVTANLAGSFNGTIETVNDVGNVSHAVAIHMYDEGGTFMGNGGNPIIVSGTVTVGNTVSVTGGLTDTQLRANPFSVYVTQPISPTSRIQVDISDASGNAGYGTTGTALKISGSVTIGAGTAQIGSVTASISSFATSVTARLINPAGTAVTYAEVGTAGSPSIDVLSVQGVTSGTAIAISGTVTANPSISSTAITSGSFTSLTSATIVPGNTARKMATVYNLGAGQLFVNAGASATTLGGGFMVALSSGDYFECGFTTTTLSAIFATAGTASWVSH